MKAIAYQLSEIPDLTLAKYSSLDASGIEGVLERHAGFLRQFSGKMDTSLHLLLAYAPGAQDGERLKVHLLACGTGRDPVGALAIVPRLVASSPLSPYFDLRPWRPEGASGPRDVEALRAPLAQELGYGDGRFPVCAALLKAAKFVSPTPPSPTEPNGYYVQPEFQVSDRSRLYSMMRLMESLAVPLVYRIDLYPTRRGDDLRTSLPLNRIRERRGQQALGRNYELEGIERSYEKLLEKLDGSPLFNANVFAFAPDPESARALLEAASSEALEKGATDIVPFVGGFEPLSFLGARPWDGAMASADGRFVAMPYRDPTERPGYFIFPKEAQSLPHCDITTLFTLEDASAFFRLPTLYDGEFVQCRRETAPPAVPERDGVHLGEDSNGQDANFPLDLFPKHAFISGMPGSGKTNTMRHFVTSFVARGIPLLVLEPAKREYRAVLNCPGMEDVRLFSPAGDTPFPLRINPFELPYGVSVGHHINRLCQVFEGSFPLEGALPFILDRSIEQVYRNHGWTPRDHRVEGGRRTFPTLSELYAQMELELEKESYEGEVKGNLTSALRMRVGGLLRRELGDLFDVPWSTVTPNEWLTFPAILELEALGTSQANFLTLLLSVLIRESLMARPDCPDRPVRHVMFFEEAHNLIGPEAEATTGEQANPKQTATAFVSDMLREVRAYGEGLVIADQLPTAIAPEVLKNTGLKVALRITSAEDRELLGAMMNANAMQLERLGVAEPGHALVAYEGLMRPFEASMVQWLGHEGSPDYVADEGERRRLAESLGDAALLAELEARGCGWRDDGVLRAFFIDLRCVESRLEALDGRLGRTFRAIAELDDAAARARTLADFAMLRSAARRALELGPEGPNPAEARLGIARDNVRLALSGARFASALDAIGAYRDLLDALEAKRGGWPQFGPAFRVFRSEPSLDALADGDPETLDWQFAYCHLDLYARIQHRIVELQEADALLNDRPDDTYYRKARRGLEALDEALAKGRPHLLAAPHFGE